MAEIWQHAGTNPARSLFVKAGFHTLGKPVMIRIALLHSDKQI